MPRKNKGQKRPAADAPASEARIAKRGPAASGPTSSDDDGAKGKRLVLRYDEVMAAGDDSATALFELANATHVVFRVGGRELTIQQDPSVASCSHSRAGATRSSTRSKFGWRRRSEAMVNPRNLEGGIIIYNNSP